MRRRSSTLSRASIYGKLTLFAIVDQFANERRIQSEQRANRVARREMIFVAFVKLDAVVLDRSR